jgi:hypothetical protein
MLVEERSRNKCFLSRFEYHMFYFLYQLFAYLLTVPCKLHHVNAQIFIFRQFEPYLPYPSNKTIYTGKRNNNNNRIKLSIYVIM